MGDAESTTKYTINKWLRFLHSKPVVPLPLEGQDLPSKAEKTTPYCLTIESADNVPVPPALTKDIAEEYEIVHRFHVSLFHVPSKR